MDGLPGIAQGAVLGQEVAQVGPGAAAAGPLLAAIAVLDDDADIEPHQGPEVGAQAAVVAGDQDQVAHRHQTGDDLAHPRVQAPRLFIDPVEQGDLVLVREAAEGIDRLVEAPTMPLARQLDPPLAAATGDSARRLGGLQQGLELDLVGIGKAGLLAALGAQTCAPLDIEVAILDDAILQHPGLQPTVLKVNIRGVDGGGLELAEELLDVSRIETRRTQDLVAGNGDGVGHRFSVRTWARPPGGG